MISILTVAGPVSSSTTIRVESKNLLPKWLNREEHSLRTDSWQIGRYHKKPNHNIRPAIIALLQSLILYTHCHHFHFSKCSLPRSHISNQLQVMSTAVTPPSHTAHHHLISSPSPPKYVSARLISRFVRDKRERAKWPRRPPETSEKWKNIYPRPTASSQHIYGSTMVMSREKCPLNIFGKVVCYVDFPKQTE